MPKQPLLAHFAVGCIVSLLALLGTSSPHAEGSFGEQSVRLSNFTTEALPIRMHGVSENIDIYIPLATTAAISNTWLDLQFTHSITLLGKRSSIRVLFNDTTLSQIPYDPAQPMSKTKVQIPDTLWRAGFNKLSLSVIQHYIDRCEDSNSPELWTELDLQSSTLSYTVEPVDRELQLRDLAGLFSPGIGALSNILLLNSPEADLTKANSSYLNEALPLVAQSLALHRDYSPLMVRHANWIANSTGQNIPETNAATGYIPAALSPEGHVLIGTRSELETILPGALLDQISGPFLHLERLDAQNNSKDALHMQKGIRLIVSGVSGNDVIRAARALAQIDDRLIALQQLSVLKEDRLSAHTSASSNYFLQPDTHYTFAELGRATTTMHGAGTKRVTVNLPIRGNFYTHESASVDLSLEFVYGAGMGTGSVMSVSLNGSFVQGLELEKPNGMAFRNFRISLPARMLRPGTNTLEFIFTLRAKTVAGECRSIPSSHLIVQLLDSSSIDLPDASPVAIQPDLAAFSATAFPYIANTNAVSSELVVASHEMLGDALSLAGKLAQRSHSLADQLFVRTTIPTRLETNTILLATPKEIPPNISVSLSESLERTQRWSYRILNFVRTASASPSRDSGQAIPLIHNGNLNNLGVLMAVRNPHSSRPAALMVIAADTHTLLTQRVATLLTPQIWGQLKGDLVVWGDPKDAVITMQVSDYYEVGEQDPWHILVLTLSNNPWYMLAALLFSFFGIGLLARKYLRDREARKLAE